LGVAVAVERGEFVVGFGDCSVGAGFVFGVGGEGDKGNFASVYFYSKVVGGYEGGKVGEECYVGGADVDGGDGAEVGAGWGIHGRAYAAERLESAKGGVWLPVVIVYKMG
jgi:hypothetical protein